MSERRPIRIHGAHFLGPNLLYIRSQSDYVKHGRYGWLRSIDDIQISFLLSQICMKSLVTVQNAEVLKLCRNYSQIYNLIHF